MQLAKWKLLATIRIIKMHSWFHNSSFCSWWLLFVPNILSPKYVTTAKRETKEYLLFWRSKTFSFTWWALSYGKREKSVHRTFSVSDCQSVFEPSTGSCRIVNFPIIGDKSSLSKMMPNTITVNNWDLFKFHIDNIKMWQYLHV